jgi:hypothetical protein
MGNSPSPWLVTVGGVIWLTQIPITGKMISTFLYPNGIHERGVNHGDLWIAGLACVPELWSADELVFALAAGIPTARPIVSAATPTALRASPIFPPRVR